MGRVQPRARLRRPCHRSLPFSESSTRLGMTCCCQWAGFCSHATQGSTGRRERSPDWINGDEEDFLRHVSRGLNDCSCTNQPAAMFIQELVLQNTFIMLSPTALDRSNSAGAVQVQACRAYRSVEAPLATPHISCVCCYPTAWQKHASCCQLSVCLLVLQEPIPIQQQCDLQRCVHCLPYAGRQKHTLATSVSICQRMQPRRKEPHLAAWSGVMGTASVRACADAAQQLLFAVSGVPNEDRREALEPFAPSPAPPFCDDFSVPPMGGAPALPFSADGWALAAGFLTRWAGQQVPPPPPGRALPGCPSAAGPTVGLAPACTSGHDMVHRGAVHW